LSSENLLLIISFELLAIARIEIVGFVPCFFEEVGDNILQVFFGFFFIDPVEQTGEIRLEQFNLFALEALLEVGLVEGFHGGEQI
jgi:hypothetical protein